MAEMTVGQDAGRHDTKPGKNDKRCGHSLIR